jgi:hypothetical protein
MYDGLGSVGIADNNAGVDQVNVYPNPTAGISVVQLNISEAAMVNLKLYDMLGREVKTIVSEKLQAGSHKVETNVSGLENGIYYYHLNINNKKSTYKLMIAK